MLQNENFHIFSYIEILFCAKYIEKMNKNTNSKFKNFPAIIRATPRLKYYVQIFSKKMPTFQSQLVKSVDIQTQF